MKSIIKAELENLFKLLEINSDLAKKDISMLLNDITTEAIFEAKEGLKKENAEKINSLEYAALDKVETASSRILVRYYANHKKNYNERQKEIFLTFLLTNKLQRTLSKLEEGE